MKKAIIYLSAAITMTSCSTISPWSKNVITSSASESVEPKSTFCQKTDNTFKCVKVVEVYDRDTIFIDLPDQHPLFGRRMGVRLFGIDTPEKRSKNACEKQKVAEAQAVLEKILNRAASVDILNAQKDKFFRILGEVVADGRPLINDLIKLKVRIPIGGTVDLPPRKPANHVSL